MQINKVTNANVYLDGISLMGKLEEIDLGDISQKMEEYKALGVYATIELPAGLDKIEAKLKWNSFYPESIAGLNFQNITNLIIRSKIEKFGSLGKTEESELVTIINGTFKKIPLGKYKAQEKVDNVQHEMTVYYVKQLVDDIPTVEVDIFRNVINIGQANMLDNFALTW